jgi:hypothetical protein
MHAFGTAPLSAGLVKAAVEHIETLIETRVRPLDFATQAEARLHRLEPALAFLQLRRRPGGQHIG